MHPPTDPACRQERDIPEEDHGPKKVALDSYNLTQHLFFGLERSLRRGRGAAIIRLVWYEQVTNLEGRT